MICTNYFYQTLTTNNTTCFFIYNKISFKIFIQNSLSKFLVKILKESLLLCLLYHTGLHLVYFLKRNKLFSLFYSYFNLLFVRSLNILYLWKYIDSILFCTFCTNQASLLSIFMLVHVSQWEQLINIFASLNGSKLIILISLHFILQFFYELF